MAYNTIDIVLILKIKIGISHVITRMTLGTHALIAARIGTEIIHQDTFTQMLARFGVFVIPSPVLVFHKLMARRVVTFEAGFSDFRAVGKRPFQFF
jgi:hypothetical protein